MSEYQIKLTGWQAIVGCIVLVCVVGVRLMTINNQKDNTALTEQLEILLISDYYPDDVQKLTSVYESGDIDATDTVAKSIASTKLSIDSVQTSFPIFSFTSNKEVVVKVTYSLNDETHTRKKGTNYYLFRYGMIGDTWQYKYYSNVARYYLNFV